MEYWGIFWMSISVSALGVVTIYRLPLGTLEAHYLVRVGEGPSLDRFTWRVVS
jgi:hypothetical protein